MTIISSRETSLAAGLRLAGQSRKVGAQLTTAEVADSCPASAPAKCSSVRENFKSALVERLERFQKSGQSCSSSPAEVDSLASSLAQAAAEVKDIYGQNAANKFMAAILSDVSNQGLTFESLTTSISGALKDIAQEGQADKLKKITDAFNRGLGQENEDGHSERSVKGLSQALGDFFEVEPPKNGADIQAQGFNSRGNWAEVAVPESGQEGNFIEGTPEAAQAALESAANFSLEKLGSDTKDDLVNFLRHELGAVNAAEFLAGAPDQADFMSTIDKVIDLALDEAEGADAAAKLQEYLNDGVKQAVNSTSDLNKNPFGEIEFEGWSITGGTQAGGEPAITAKWRYTNRDDVSFTRTGGIEPQPKEAEAADGEDEAPLRLGDLVKKINGGQMKATGELVDIQV